LVVAIIQFIESVKKWVGKDNPLNILVISFSEYYYLWESFDTVSDFLLNPEHRDRTFSDLRSDFEASGGEVIGAGRYGTVFTHPKWPYVIKTFTRDDPYVKFVRYAYRNPLRSFPKFYGTPKKIVPFIKRSISEKEIYISRIEKLIPLGVAEFSELNQAKRDYEHYMWYKDTPYRMGDGSELTELIEMKNKLDALPQNMKDILSDHNTLMGVVKKENWPGVDDWHRGNVMKRANGSYVLIDPLWEGYTFNAHAEYEHAMRMETDYYANDYDEPYYLRGGELPKKKRVKKPKPVQMNYVEDDIPF